MRQVILVFVLALQFLVPRAPKHRQQQTSPRGVYETHLSKLRQLMQLSGSARVS